MNLEYEYSFKTDDVNKYIEYCELNNYEKVFEGSQIRKIYKNDSSIIGRITINTNKDDESIVFDFKGEDMYDGEVLKERYESLPWNISSNELSNAESILELLNYKLTVSLERTRVIYVKDEVKFEIDKYVKPEIYNVVGIEGEKDEVDRIYKSLI